MTRRSSTIRTTISPTSRSHVSLWWFCFWNRKQRKHATGKPLLEREREIERNEKVLWSVLHSRCHRKVDGTIFGVIVFRLSEHSFLMDEISENIFNEELDKLLLVKIQFRENYIWMSTTWRSKIQSEGIRNTHYSSHNESMKLKDNNYWKPNRASSTREYICVADWGWRTIFIKKAMQEIAKNWRIKKKLLSRGNTETQWRLEEFPMQHDQESRTVNLFFYDPDLLSSKDGPTFPHQALNTSSSRKHCREVGMPRNTRESMSIPGHVFDRQHARRDPEKLHNSSRNLATPSGIADDVDDSEKGRNWEKWERRTIAINTFI